MSEAHAEVLISYDEESGYFHIYAKGDGSTATAIRTLMQVIQSSLTKRRLNFVRRDADVVSEKNFETEKMEHRGFTRFSFKDEPGERIDSALQTDGAALHVGLGTILEK